MTKKKTTRIYTVGQPAEFACAWLNVDRFASTDDYKERLNGTQIEDFGDRVRLIATDSYKLAWCCPGGPVELDAKPSVSYTVRRDARTGPLMRRVLKRWTGKGVDFPTLALTFTDAHVVFDVNDGEETLRVPLCDPDQPAFPDWQGLVAKFTDDGEVDAQTFNPDQLLVLAKLHTTSKDRWATTLRLGAQAHNPAVIEATCTPPLSALVMPQSVS